MSGTYRQKAISDTVMAKWRMEYTHRISAKLVMELPNWEIDWLSQKMTYFFKFWFIEFSPYRFSENRFPVRLLGSL